ncbi:MAG: hypothetical protein CFH21_00465 [Alphaproteobacteria bacterium MarineAlpha5_Bin11]|nr:hypothetical protein [Pelagibacteraceae bacterium]PPR44169.1 MAG: hypothetical protein CFH21_00465 [Alphaproteobacteria bacterium MarineAlpha5_Bin11]|tara:strand:- start:297 stop:605 length:309 start_codon:yes stop_codon:yes gene_type:complete
MAKKITFFAFGRDSYYHREWFKKHGFKFDRSSKKWAVYNLSEQLAEEYSSYCREFGLNFERSDRNIESFDYVDYLWEGRRGEFMKSYEKKILPKPLSQKTEK